MAFKGEVLLADDDEDILEMVSMVLLRAGYSVARAVNGLDAVELARSRSFDVALLDLMMPGLDGVSALEEIKKYSPGVEVIILTAHGSVETAVTTMRLGAFDYLRKPFALDALEAAVEKALERKRVNDLLGAAFRAGVPDDLPAAIAASAARLFGADEVLLCPAGESAWAGLASYSAAGGGFARERAGLCAAGEAALAAGAGEILAAAPSADPRFREVPGAAGLAAVLFMPLAEGGRRVGTLYAGRLPGGLPFSESDLRRALTFGPALTLALRNYELDGQLRAVRLRLAQAQKLESLGLLAGQVSHDFNNMLSVIIGSVQLLMENLQPGKGMRISEEILRMARESELLVKQLLSFARKGDGPPAPLDLNAEIGNIRMILDRLPGAPAVEYAPGAGLPPVRIRADQFKQAVINLVGNAKNSMPGGGRARVTTRLAADGEKPPEGLPPGCVVLEVLDEGGGIREEDLPRIFEPFFSTRPAGKGTGLGLHIARSAAREAGGELVAANRPEGGAVFRMFLPPAV